MSYNITKVSSKSPNSSSEITLNLEDVSSVATPSADQVLGYNGSNWINQSPSWVNEYEESSRTNVVNTSFSLNSNIPIPRTNLPSGEQYFWAFGAKNISSTVYLNTINTSNSTITAHYITASANWNYKVVLNNAGLYRLWAKLPIGPSSATNSSLEVQWSNADNTVTYGPRFRMHRYDMKQIYAVGYINASGGESVGLYAHANNNSAKNPNNYANHIMIIEKLS